MPTLIAHVALFDEKGFLQQFGPGDEPPEWACKKLTNPKLWDQAPDDSEPAGGGDEPPPPAGTGSDPVPTVGGDAPPPLAGTGSGRDRWAAYAAGHGVQVGEDDKRDEIVAKLREANIPVE